MDRRFAIVPEWVIDAPISDTAFRLYSVLLRYGQTSGQRMPGRATLARRLHKKSTDTVDRALRELVDIGAVRVEHRHSGKQRLSNRYHLITDTPVDAAKAEPGSRTNATTPPPSKVADRSETCDDGDGDGRGRAGAATPAGASSTAAAVTSGNVTVPYPGGRTTAARGGGIAAARVRRTSAAGVAAPLRHDPGIPTQTTAPPTSPHATTVARDGNGGGRGGSITDENRRLLATCWIPDLDALAAHCQQLREAAGKPTGRWTARQLRAALDRAVTDDGWPASAAVPALLAVAADPATASPMRLTAPGPWWELPYGRPATVLSADEQAELHRLTAQLELLPDSGVGARYAARAQLTTEQQPRTRLTISRRAVRIHQERRQTAS